MLDQEGGEQGRAIESRMWRRGLDRNLPMCRHRQLKGDRKRRQSGEVHADLDSRLDRCTVARRRLLVTAAAGRDRRHLPTIVMLRRTGRVTQESKRRQRGGP